MVARESPANAPFPAWMRSSPDKLRILVHSLPVRQHIDAPVQEQLIVE